MKNIMLSILLISILLAGWRCKSKTVAPQEEPIRDLTLIEKSMVTADNNFGLKLFKEIVRTEPNENIFISPLSISMALGMTWNGANGTTKEAMQAALEKQDLTIEQVNESYKNLIDLLTALDSKVRFQIANSIWYRNSLQFEQDFIDLNQNYFNALVTGLDFNSPEAVPTINDWVAQNTFGKIKQIVDPPIDPITIMFLINAIYFKGIWTYQFDINETYVDTFQCPDGSKIPCNMMRQSNDFRYNETAKYQVIDLPYGNEKFRMTIVLPRPSVSIDSLISTLTPKNWSDLTTHFFTLPGVIMLPRFKLEYELELKKALGTLGMEIAFSNHADFTKMYHPGGINISQVKHKTFVEVNEEGTEAAAVTAVVIGLTSVSENFTMRMNRPFIFAIRDTHSGSILFIGKMGNPGFEAN